MDKIISIICLHYECFVREIVFRIINIDSIRHVRIKMHPLPVERTYENMSNTIQIIIFCL